MMPVRRVRRPLPSALAKHPGYKKAGRGRRRDTRSDDSGDSIAAVAATLEPAVSCCAEHRSHPTLFVAVVALSAVAFVGQALTLTATDDAIAVASFAATCPTPR